MNAPWNIRQYGTDVPKNFWKRKPVIEVWILCSRCGGDFAGKEYKVMVERSPGYPPRTLENCPDCVAGRQRVYVPLRSIIRSIAWRGER